MIRAVFFDIDGTLVTRQGQTLPSTDLALNVLKKQGILRGIATGRGPGNLIDRLEDLKLDVFITYNGQYIYTKEKVLYANPFSEELVARLALFGNQEKRHLLFGSATGMSGSSLMSFGQKTWAKRLQRFLPRGKFLHRLRPIFTKLAQSSKAMDYSSLPILQEPIYQCVLICPLEDQPAVEALFPECDVTRSNPYTVDIILKGTSKSTAIQRVATEFDFTLAETMAFGDSWNDFEMLRDVKIGVAMGNGNQDIKDLANYITASNEDNGIYQALVHYDLVGGKSSND